MEDKKIPNVKSPGKPEKMRTITFEEHFATPAFMEGPGRWIKERGEATNTQTQTAVLINRLCDIGKGRIAEMDAAGIDMQAISLNSPGVEQLDTNEALAFVREANDQAAEAVRSYPDRFIGLACIPTAAPGSSFNMVNLVGL